MQIIRVLIPICVILAVTIPHAGCGEAPAPPDPLAERFRDYYAGEMIQREISRLGGEDEAALEHRLDSLRTRFGFTSEEADSLLNSFRDPLPRWEAFLNDVLKKIEEQDPDSTGGSRTP